MQADVVYLPIQLKPQDLQGRTAVIFDVLRATTVMAAAFAAGIRSIRAFGSIEALNAIYESMSPRPLRCGEVDGLAPPGWAMGNSPDQFDPQRDGGQPLLMSTTNGTKAIVAARSASHIFAAALVNRSAAAGKVAAIGADVTLICSGTKGQYSLEDSIGAGAVLDRLIAKGYEPATDAARISHRLFLSVKDNLPAALRTGFGGHNCIRLHLEKDIDYAARLDVFDFVATVVDPHALVLEMAT